MDAAGGARAAPGDADADLLDGQHRGAGEAAGQGLGHPVPVPVGGIDGVAVGVSDRGLTVVAEDELEARLGDVPVKAFGERLDAVVRQVQQRGPYIGVHVQQILPGLGGQGGVVAELDGHAVVLRVSWAYVVGSGSQPAARKRAHC